MDIPYNHSRARGDFKWQDNAGHVLVFVLPFLIGAGGRLDLALVFGILSLVFFLVLPLFIHLVQDLFSSRVLISLALILSGGLAASFDIVASWLLPGIWSQLHLYLPLLAGSPLLIYPLIESRDNSLGDKAGGALKRWALLAFLVTACAFVRECLGTGGITLNFGPGMEGGFQLIPSWLFSLPVLLLSPFVFFLAGFILMIRQHVLAGKNLSRMPDTDVTEGEQ